MINHRLFDHYGIDTSKDLKIRERCPRPFDTVLIDKKGSCYACECQSWLPQSIGNLQLKKLGEIVGSTVHKTLQASIMDGTYRYCNEHQCSYIKNKGINDSWNGGHIRYLRLAIDDSCNLQCPSCRKKMIFHKEGSAYQLGIKLADEINDWLSQCQHPLQVHMGSDGDPFASHIYRHFMEQTPRRNNITYSILTNGLMIKDFHHKIPHIVDNLQELGVSIDGASKSTYEKLRLGGKWDKINENLEFISKLKDRVNFKFRLHFVVQKENYHEMEQIVRLGRKYRVDRVWLSRIHDWNTLTNFSEHDIFNPTHPLHADFKEKLLDLEKNDSGIIIERGSRQERLDSDGIVERETLDQLH